MRPKLKWESAFRVNRLSNNHQYKCNNAHVRTGLIINICCERGYSLKSKEIQETHTHPSATQLSRAHFLTPENDEDIIIYRKNFGAVTPPDQPNFLFEENTDKIELFFFPFGNNIINPNVTTVISGNERCVLGQHSNKNGKKSCKKQNF